MSRHLKSFLISFAGLLGVLSVSAVAISIYADVNGWDSFTVGVGPVVAMTSTSSASESSMTLGPGLLLLALGGAALNALAVLGLRRRTVPA